MLNDLKIDDLLGKVDSRYGLVVSSAKRARQINEYTSTLGLNDALGIPGPQVHTRSQHPLTIAIEELRQGKLDVTFKQPPEETEDQVGAAGPGVPEATTVDTGAPEDDEEGAGAA
jgi:DNA-directed RNA polymerase subunit omega